MSQYKEIRSRPWFNSVYKDQYTEEEYIPDENNLNVDHLNTYTIDWITTIEENGTFDYFLLMDFKDYFDGWTQELFSSIDPKIRKAIKELFRSQGIYMATNQRDATIPEQLVSLLDMDDCPIWPQKDLAVAMLVPTFKCLQMTPRPGTPSATSARGTTPLPATTLQQSGTRALTDLAKLYNNDMKFTGDLHDVLNIKLNIFYDTCQKVGITEDKYDTAFATMLLGKAQSFYYQHLAQKSMPFPIMVERMRAYFHTPENHQLFLHEWRTTMLKDIVTSNLDKTMSQCLEIVIERLQRTYQGLVQNFGSGEGSLAGQLISACQGVEACSSVLIRPASTFEAVASDLRSAVGIWTRCQQNRQLDNHSHLSQQRDSDAFYTDRRYNRSDGRHAEPQDQRSGYRRYDEQRRPHEGNSRYQRGSYNNRRPTRSKKCFVCGKQGCWSTRHSPDERARSRQRFRTYAQEHDVDPDYEIFLAGFEGIHIGDDESSDRDENNDLDAYYAGHDDQFYTTTCGNISGQLATTTLNNAATTHAITGADPYKGTAKEETHMFTFDSRYGENVFQGIMPDTGAAGISTAGREQVKALQLIRDDVHVDKSTAGRHRIRFGDNPECVSIGDIRVDTPFGVISFAVMPTNTPFLLCLADMDRHGVYLNNVDNVLVHKDKKYPIVRKWGHPWLLCDATETAIHYLTETELRQLHRRFGHPAAERFHKVLSRAGYNDVSQEVIKSITKVCHQCQLHGKAPGRFKFTIHDDVDFNFKVIVDVMYINQKPVLHAVDEATAFQAARFLPNMQANTTWDTLRAMWIDMYVGPPDVIATDAGKNFISEEFVNSAKSMAIEVTEVPVEAHNSVGKVERYHAVIRRAFEVISEDIGRSTPPENILQMAVKAVNDTAGPDGLVPTLLVFGTYPRLSKHSPPSPSIAARATAICKAMIEIRKLKAARQVNDALATRNGPSVTELLQLPLQSNVRVWRESKGWSGPYKLIAFNNDNTAAIVSINGRDVTFRVTVVRPYYCDSTANLDTPHEATDNHEDSDHPAIDDEEFIPHQDEQPRRRRGRPKGSKNKPKTPPTTAYLAQREQDDLALARQLRAAGKITTSGGPFELSTKAEIDALITRGVFRFEIYHPEKHGGVRIFKSRIVNEVKGKTTQPYEKSRLVVQGYNDAGKKVVLTQSPTIQRASQRVIMTLAPSLIARGMTLWLRDITQAYTQSDDQLQRTIIADLPIQLKDAYPAGTVMVVVKPLYGIAEAGAYWWSTYFKHHTEKLDMETSTYDPCLLITKETAAGFGIVGMQTDDTLGLTDRQFATKEDTELRFSAKEKQELMIDAPIVFNGCVVDLDQTGTINLRQKRQGEKLKIAHGKQSYIQQRARGAYIATICQPEASFDLAAAAQTTDPQKEEIVRLNKRIQWQKDNVSRGLTYVQLDMDNLKLFAMVDASFANNKDMSSQMGYVIVLGNESTIDSNSFQLRGNIVHWSSIKCKRITRSVLASEIYAMTHGVDIAIAIGTTINRIMERLKLPKVPIVVCTDSFSLYECLVKLGTTKEKRLMIDIMALREAYERGELTDIRWIDGRDNPSDSMTKAGPNTAMETLINTNQLQLRVQGWVHRNKDITA